MENRENIVAGVGWLGLGRVAAQGWRVIANVVLARLLLPSDFGLMGMAAALLNMVQPFATFGIETFLVQREEVRREHFLGAFWVGLAVGGVIYASCLGAAPLLAVFYGEPKLGAIIALAGLPFLISALSTVNRAILYRGMQFKRMALAEIAAMVLSSCVAIYMAAVGFGVWSLVAGGVGNHALLLLFYLLAARWRPTLRSCGDEIREMMGFNLGLVGANLLAVLKEQAPVVLIGKWFGAATLGVYTLSDELINIPRRHLIPVLSRVMFPVFSRAQKDDAALRSYYLKVVGAAAVVAFPVLVGLALVSPYFVLGVYGEKWLRAVPVIQILAALGVLYSVLRLVPLVIIGKGNVRLNFNLNLFTAAVLLVALFIGRHYGFIGVCAALVAYGVVMFLASARAANRLIGLPHARYLMALWPATAGSLVMSTAVVGCDVVLRHVGVDGDLMRLAVLVPVGVVSYVGLFRIFRFDVTETLFQVIATYWHGLRRWATGRP